MQCSHKLIKRIRDEAHGSGLCILCLGLGENQRPSGFFIGGFTATAVASRITETHNPLSATYRAARDYWKGYQSLLDHTEPVEHTCDINAKRHVDHVKAVLSARLLDDLLFSYGCAARAEIERQQQRRQRNRRKKGKKGDEPPPINVA